MKVQFTSEMKKAVTVYEMPAVRKVIEYMNDDESTVKEYAKMASRIASGCNIVKVLEASARIAANRRVWNAYVEGSAQFDVWIEFTTFTDNGFVMGGVYITDLWACTRDNHDEIRNRMYIRKFTELK